MQNRGDNFLLLRIVTPDSPASEVSCDSVRLTLGDDSTGRGGGAYGIHGGHAKSIMSLDKGPVSAFLNGEIIFNCSITGGFAKIEDNTVTVVAEELIK